VRPRQFDVVLCALEAGDVGVAISHLADLEWQAFQRHDWAAGELGYARARAENGDLAAAAAIVREISEGGR
jgi:hypothetical protein